MNGLKLQIQCNGNVLNEWMNPFGTFFYMKWFISFFFFCLLPFSVHSVMMMWLNLNFVIVAWLICWLVMCVCVCYNISIIKIIIIFLFVWITQYKYKYLWHYRFVFFSLSLSLIGLFRTFWPWIFKQFFLLLLFIHS